MLNGEVEEGESQHEHLWHFLNANLVARQNVTDLDSVGLPPFCIILVKCFVKRLLNPSFF